MIKAVAVTSSIFSPQNSFSRNKYPPSNNCITLYILLYYYSSVILLVIYS